MGRLPTLGRACFGAGRVTLRVSRSPWVPPAKSWRPSEARPRGSGGEKENRDTPEALAGVGVPQEATDGAGAPGVTCVAYQGRVAVSKNQPGSLGMIVARLETFGQAERGALIGTSLLLVISTYQGAVDHARSRPCASRDT